MLLLNMANETDYQPSLEKNSNPEGGKETNGNGALQTLSEVSFIMSVLCRFLIEDCYTNLLLQSRI
jgi:hypothetical protein